jgi:hypothetical protein
VVGFGTKLLQVSNWNYLVLWSLFNTKRRHVLLKERQDEAVKDEEGLVILWS